MVTRWMRTIVGGVSLLSLTACAESLHQTQRMTMLSQAQENGYVIITQLASRSFTGWLPPW